MEIYNFKSLSEELNANGHYDSGKSDTETLFNFIYVYGLKKTITKIDGMYAFGYFDLDKNELSMKIELEKSFILFFWVELFYFSSEIKSILISNLNVLALT